MMTRGTPISGISGNPLILFLDVGYVQVMLNSAYMIEVAAESTEPDAGNKVQPKPQRRETPNDLRKFLVRDGGFLMARGIPKSSISIGFSIITHLLWGTTMTMEPPRCFF